MKLDFLYSNVVGRTMMKGIQKSGILKVLSMLMKTSFSRLWIPYFIKKNRIDMKEFEGKTFNSFAQFFSRKKDSIEFDKNNYSLISPCDGLLTMYPITTKMNIPMKGSYYRLIDIIKDTNIEEYYKDGLCLVFRLRASDYHRFCSIDDAYVSKTTFIDGQLHSVQPIACERFPVYRLNRRWMNLLNTKHFEQVVQIEIGAMLVGDVSIKEKCLLKKGEDMGSFELAGSTIVLLLNERIKNRLEWIDSFQEEVFVEMGQKIGGICVD